METNQRTKLQDAIDALRPEAQIIIEAASKDLSTKDGYGLVVGLLGRIPSSNMRKLVLTVMVLEGYSKETAQQIFNMI